jgi:hypothetical protein
MNSRALHELYAKITVGMKAIKTAINIALILIDMRRCLMTPPARLIPSYGSLLEKDTKFSETHVKDDNTCSMVNR